MIAIDEHQGCRVADRDAADERSRFDELYEAHVGDVLSYALRRSTDREDAADLVAETFLLAWRKLPEIPADGGALPWLYVVAGNLLANHYRRSRTRHALVGALADQLRRHPVAPPPTDDRVRAVSAAMGRLSPADRELLRLTLWEELTPAEIARAMDTEPAVIRTRLHRARTRLRTEVTAGIVPQVPDAGSRAASIHPLQNSNEGTR
ncbi:sigma-70 family RNA polymerase sigma factor [Nakamurella silvestris]|nr:sigma-70 family RNA polymerase sigma factor [Nakamurella silvestris]